MDTVLTTTDVLSDTTLSKETIQNPTGNHGRIVPTVTTGTNATYIEACARSNELAAFTEALTLLFQAEKLKPLFDEETYINSQGRSLPTSPALWSRLTKLTESDVKSMIYESTLLRLKGREPGMFIAEAGNFAAVTCWEPRFAPPPPASAESLLALKTWNGTPIAEMAEERPLFFDFNQQIEQAKEKHLYPLLWKNFSTVERNYLDNARCEYTREVLDTNKQGANHDPRLLYWKLCMTSRNPAKQPPVQGAVRAIIEPFVRRFIDDGVAAIWLEAGSVRARDVYSWFGFRTVGECSIGQNQQGEPVSTWFMLCTPP